MICSLETQLTSHPGQIGKIMHSLITRGRNCNPIYDDPEFIHVILYENDTSELMTMGELLLDAPYSAALRGLVLECLACDWEKRPRARGLLTGVELGIKACDEARAEAARAKARSDDFFERYEAEWHEKERLKEKRLEEKRLEGKD
jgi:hypothetical protein